MKSMLTILSVLALALAPTHATGQVVPGSRSRARGTIRAEFLDAVLKGVRVTSSAWEEGWASGDAEALAELYMDEALVVTPLGDEFQGREDIRAYLESAAPETARLETFLSDLDASNNMAMTVERYVRTLASPGMPQERGLLFTVYMNESGFWRIRTQVFRPAGQPGG